MEIGVGGVVRSVADFVLVPSNFLILLLTLGVLLLLFRLWRRLAVGAMTFAVAALLIFGYTSMGELLMMPLVTRFPPVDPETAPAPHGIIVVGAALDEDTAATMDIIVEMHDGAETVLTAAFLAKRFPNTRVIVSGGGPHERQTPADGMRRLLVMMGVEDSRIAVDRDSLSTYDHIVNTLRLVGADRDKIWWVITPAHRMARVIGTYRNEGFEPVAFPVDFRWTSPFDPFYTRPMLEGLQMTDDAVHEWIGMTVYRLTGRTDAFFPAPH